MNVMKKILDERNTCGKLPEFELKLSMFAPSKMVKKDPVFDRKSARQPTA